MAHGVACLNKAPPGSLPGNRQFRSALDLPRGIISERAELGDFIRCLATPREYGAVPKSRRAVKRFTRPPTQKYTFERNPAGRTIIEYYTNPLPGGGLSHYTDLTSASVTRVIKAARVSGRGDKSTSRAF